VHCLACSDFAEVAETLIAVVALLALGAIAAHVAEATARVAGGLASGASVSALLAAEAVTPTSVRMRNPVVGRRL
jgi:hypothetical protein